MLKKTLPFILLLLALPALGLGCRQQVKPEKVTLTYWRVFDGKDSMSDIINAYTARHPNVSIKYKKLRFEEYEQKFLEALAEDRGPDIFSIHNTWIGKYQTKIAPLPPTVTVPEQVLKGTIKQEIVTEIRTKNTITKDTIKKQFIDVVAGDIIRQDAKGAEQIYGLPLSVDTLVLFYNRDILNAAGLVGPPKNWTEFLNNVARITRLGDAGEIIVGGTALGTASNIPRFADILSVLMMQNGAKMTDSRGYATFHLVPEQFPNKSYVPGIEALRFYADFANPTKEAYTWNEQMPDALEAFAQERIAFFIGYSYHIPLLRAQSPQLNWEVAPLPQADKINNQVNFANYWVETVSQKSKNQDEAWDFIQFAANEKNVKSYLGKTSKPTALRALIESQLQDPLLEPFAGQLLTATSWYRGKNAALAEEALGDLIMAVVNGTEELDAAVNTTVKRINQTIR